MIAREDYLKDKKIVYKGEALLKGTPKEAMISLTVLVIVCVLGFNFTSALHFAGIIRALIIAFAALCINYILKKGTFGITYILTDDNWLVYVTRYGKLSWETAWIDLSKAEIHNEYIVFEKRQYEFFPDEELKGLIG